MIPEGYEWRGDGYCVGLAASAGVGVGDRVVSSGIIAGPFLVVQVGLWSGGGVGSLQGLVYGGAVEVPFVVGQLVSVPGVILAEHGPMTESTVGSAGPPVIGPEAGKSRGLWVWPWYLWSTPGVLVLWVRSSSLFVATTGRLAASVWGLRRVGVAAGPRGRFVAAPRRGALVS